MTGRSSPTQNTETDIDISLDVSSIQDPIQTKLGERNAIAKTNSEQLKRLVEVPKSALGQSVK